MAKYYGLTFLPWIILAVVSGYDVQAGAGAGLAAAVVLLAADLRRGRRWDELILEISTAVFLAGFTALVLAAPHAAVVNYGASLSIGWLALTAWGTIAAGVPFTEGIARRQVSAEVAATALFHRIAVVLTAAWAAAFTVSAVSLGIVQHFAPHQTALLIVIKVACFAVPAWFTGRYPAMARKRYAAAQAVEQTAA
ncbi:hypothetical protein DZF91_19990 [Actinomadura logoneensis]|uniref:DUF3159 domain-containing protein n=1 Tax=Actinomadura logoneensis TaxID=2293572 RepID=A0A372JIQ3_9ACTN|nr:hypothetical protein [Actinomadura logoneensis]RFU39887.1 hypothetical protein DZF91_19990 [Actinomadura logoneensis]